jgi:hypothetical protein
MNKRSVEPCLYKHASFYQDRLGTIIGKILNRDCRFLHQDVESGYNLTFADSVYKNGDDCLAFRSGSFVFLRTPWPAGPIAPVERVRIRNMTLTSSRCAEDSH